MDRCPNCRARLDDAETCRRCGMELGLLRATEQAAETWLRRAIAHLRCDEFGHAQQALRRALSLRRDPLTESLLGLLDQKSVADSDPLASRATAAGRLDDEAESAVNQVRRVRGRRLQALYNRFFHKR